MSRLSATTSATAIVQLLSSAQQLAIVIEIAPIPANIDAVRTLMEATSSNPIGTQHSPKESAPLRFNRIDKSSSPPPLLPCRIDDLSATVMKDTATYAMSITITSWMNVNARNHPGVWVSQPTAILSQLTTPS
jgi:hypothetical protein